MKRFIEMKKTIGREWTEGERYEILDETETALLAQNNLKETIPVRKSAQGKYFDIVGEEWTDEEVSKRFGAKADMVLRASLIDRALKTKDEDRFKDLTTNGWNERLYREEEVAYE